MDRERERERERERDRERETEQKENTFHVMFGSFPIGGLELFPVGLPDAALTPLICESPCGFASVSKRLLVAAELARWIKNGGSVYI